MVEGPGCTINGQKISAKLKNQHVKKVNGNGLKRPGSETKPIQPKPVQTGSASVQEDVPSKFQQLKGRTLDNVQTLGKELFLYFGDICLRVHFLMNGSIRISDQTHFGHKASDKASKALSLEIQFSEGVLQIYESSVDVRSSAVCRQKHAEFQSLDVCSSVFSHKRAVELVKAQQGRQLCDVLLDQNILPGSGNIIKNEALFDSWMNPSAKVEEVEEAHISYLIKMLREFTMVFYKCRKTGRPLKPHLRIYNCKSCGHCGGPVILTRMGDDSGRFTYFCQRCQTGDWSTVQKKLRSSGTLLSWVQLAQNEEWSCSTCTLINQSNTPHCVVCLTQRKHKQEPQDSMGLVSTLTGIMGADPYSKTVLGPHTTKRRVDEVVSESEGGYKKARTVKEKMNPGSNPGVAEIPAPTAIKTNPDECSSWHASPQRSKSRNTAVDGSSCITSPNKTGNESKIPFCPNHKTKAAMFEVRKEGQNKGRWFFSCPQSNRKKKCSFFQWADTYFPICEGHGKSCTIRRVMKLGPNNGRKFFACSLPRKKQCQFFQWAVGYD